MLLCALSLLLAGCASPSGGVQRSAESRSSDSDISGGWVVIQRGDTMGGIAARADVPLARLQRFNPDANPNRLAVGQRLLIPTQQERAPSGGPYRYQIRPGDTYSGIARRFGTTASRIQSANPGTQPTQLRVGQIIQVPLRGGAAAATASSSSPAASRPSSASTPARTSTPTPATGNIPSSARNWPWPLDDYRIVRAYGTDSNGTLQPMLLATNRGAQAKAVADGDVRFAGSMRQLGRVAIVHHADNLQSVYALCDNLLVSEGDRISRGTPVCDVGFSNATERYDLLFDMRLGGKPIDPRRVLR
ncbi:LysM peptidoglycan-binding domain-containing protein [Billgrantia kenyensis]|uniref:LysM peptidoglycan-binding domain-containing protein n=1 Tax=Billgrantia kenyensis TaxID=321266 RepID=A0A7V9VXV8_9GAMM|nr:LysM peptidoglycan-binding domain-containing protein [Halomonas kenyensis]MBA2777346.1 LysM peptidoglycan-binding domain-containing protein [Halomonas kenyensis]MCG6660016.1 LysM peptidoglycan-binding domain-containing protein [Halomonas kenyensis]